MQPRKLNDSLAFNINRAALLLRRDLIRALAEYELTPEQWQILMMLKETAAAVSQREIVETLLNDKHTVSRMIQRLESKGWVAKDTSDHDARITVISLTRKGHKDLDKMYYTLSTHVQGEVFNEFTQKEKDAVKSFLKRLRVALGDDLQL